MKKIWTLSALVAASVAGWMLVPAEPACAFPNCRVGGETSTTWGMGSTCEEAQLTAFQTLINWIPDDCDVCRAFVVPLGDCHDGADGGKVWDFKLRYFCSQGDLGGPLM